MGGAKEKAQWMRDALVYFADDEVVQRTTPAMKAQNAIPALEVIATPAAVMELLTIEAHTPSSKWQVDKALARIASKQQLNVDELIESIPLRASLRSAKALDDSAEMSLRYGSRALRIGFDSKLEAYVVAEDGRRVGALPPAAETTPEIEAAKTVWRDLREDIGVLAPRLLAGLERAMVSGREWTFEVFRFRWLDDPVMRHVTRAVVWTQRGCAFRVAEDGTFADRNDAPVKLDDSPITVAHGPRMSNEERVAWRKIVTDYELIQPFPQLLDPPV
jgi:hypothetical protein